MSHFNSSSDFQYSEHLKGYLDWSECKMNQRTSSRPGSMHIPAGKRRSRGACLFQFVVFQDPVPLLECLLIFISFTHFIFIFYFYTLICCRWAGYIKFMRSVFSQNCFSLSVLVSVKCFNHKVHDKVMFSFIIQPLDLYLHRL